MLAISCPQLQLCGHLGSFAYFLYYKKSQSRTQVSHTYIFKYFLPSLPFSGFVHIVALETILSAVHFAAISTSNILLF